MTAPLLKLDGFEDRYPGELSGGQRQRVAVARALAVQPQVLLLDEALSALDKNLREEMQIELSLLLRKLEITTIMVTHDQAEAFAISDRIAVMERGRIVQVGTPQDVYLRIPTLSGRAFQPEAGHRSDVKPATIPINIRPL